MPRPGSEQSEPATSSRVSGAQTAGRTRASAPTCFILERNPMADSIHIKLPDGSVKDVPKGSTALDVAKSVGQRLADAALAAKTNGDLIDLTRPLEKDTELHLLTDRHPEARE